MINFSFFVVVVSKTKISLKPNSNILLELLTLAAL